VSSMPAPANPLSRELLPVSENNPRNCKPEGASQVLERPERAGRRPREIFRERRDCGEGSGAEYRPPAQAHEYEPENDPADRAAGGVRGLY
jgi:hypothetical protein